MKKLSLIAVILFCCSNIQAQIASGANQGSDWSDRIFIGGNLGASFGTVTIVSVSPMIGYKFTPKTIGGISLTYQYYKDKRFEPAISSSIYGVGLFARQFVTDEVFLHAEYEMLNFEYLNNNFEIDRKWLGTGLIGGGYAIDNFMVTFLYILNHDPNTSPYGREPYVIRVGVGF